MIRAATPNDAAAIAALWNPYIRDTTATFNAVEKSVPDVKAMIAAVLAQTVEGLALRPRIPEAGFKFDRFVDLVLMQKFL